MHCPRCQSNFTNKKGFFRRKSFRRKIQRYLCRSCGVRFSASTTAITCWQKKPQINQSLFHLLCSGVSLRRSAVLLDVSFSTVYRRFLWLGKLSEVAHNKFLSSLTNISEIYLDEMESIEHTKLKPVTLPLLVTESQQILGIASGEIPAKGHLAEISLKKYGFRQNTSSALIADLLTKIPEKLSPKIIKTDGKTTYPKLLHERWPLASHAVYCRKTESAKEQPHLSSEKKKFDAMFAINQRCAKLRRDVGRLARRSWVTTKKVENLNLHLVMYACYNNKVSPF